MHAGAWLDRLARSDGEPRDRLLAALAELAPDAATVFTPLEGEAELIDAGDPRRPDGRARGPLARLDRPGLRRPRPSDAAAGARSGAWPARPRRRLPLAVGRVHLGPPRRPGSDLVSEAGIQVGVARARAGGDRRAVGTPPRPRRRRGGRARGTHRGDGPGAPDALRGRPRDHPSRRRRAAPAAARSASRSCRPSSAARRSSSSSRRSPSGSAPSGARSRSTATFEVPWTSERISPAGRAALLAAGIAPPGAGRGRQRPHAHRPRAARPVPALRLAPDDRREPLRADPVPDDPLLRRLPPAVRIDQVGLMGRARRRRRATVCPRSSASSAPGRWAPGSARSRSRPAARSSSTTSTRRPSTRGRERIRDGLTRRAAKLDLDADERRRLGRRRGSTGSATSRPSTGWPTRPTSSSSRRSRTSR